MLTGVRHLLVFAICASFILVGGGPALTVPATVRAQNACPASDLGPPPGAQALLRGEGEAYGRARAAREGGDLRAAAALWDSVVDLDGVLAPVARLRLAETLADDGRVDDAAAAFSGAARDAALPSRQRLGAALDGAALLAGAGRETEALRLLDLVVRDEAATASDAAAARGMAFPLRRARGDITWVDDAFALVSAAPRSGHASSALEALDGAGLSVPPLIAGRVRYLAWDNDAATALYRIVADDGRASAADRAVAWFFLGALEERDSEPARALDAYRTSIAFDPGGWLADDSRWWRAKIYEQLDRPLDAVAEYDALVASFPDSGFAPGAAFDAALLQVRMGDRVDAGARFRALARGDSADAALAARWLVVVGQARFDDPAPDSIDPASFGALLNRAGSTATEPLPAAALFEWSADQPDWDAADRWMRETFGEPPPGEDTADKTTTLALALAAVGERGLASTLLAGRPGELAGSPYALLDLARTASRAGLNDIALFAATRLMREVPPAARIAAPSAVARLAYPAPFCEELLAAAGAERLPPLLLLALTRQESAFDPEAMSAAGASGLTQVVPATGQDIARSLGVPWRPDDLLKPEVSLRFGAHYLAAQLELFDGDLLAALSAYNGGPGSALRWLDSQWLPGPDGYYAVIDFGETRRYVELVLESYGWYRYLYAGAPLPSIR